MNNHPLRHFDGTECVWPPSCTGPHQRPKHRLAVAPVSLSYLRTHRRAARHRLGVPVDSPSLSTAPARHLRTV